MSSSHVSPSTPSGFTGLGLDASLLRGIEAAGFDRPRPIQVETIPAALAGRDVLGLAQTGTGKTAAFALPLLSRLLAGSRSPHAEPRGRDDRRTAGPRALILAPTRELASQIDAELRMLARFTRISSVTVYGGVSARAQADALRRGTDVVVACPGRLLDHLRQGALRLSRVETLVLDEADHMFDMGFLPDIRRILAALPARRQNLLFSATMPAEVRHLADDVLRNAHVVELSHSRPVETVEHSLYPVAEGRKVALLQHLLGEGSLASAIVFTRTKHRAKRLAQQLDRAGHRAVALQGNMSQNQRDRAMRGFRERRFDVLVATDIAARGIDVSKVTHVINFDMPITPDAYTHRIGRTGRSENEGKAFTFVTGEDRSMVRAIERVMGAPIPRCELPAFAGAEAGATGANPDWDRRGERGEPGRGPRRTNARRSSSGSRGGRPGRGQSRGGRSSAGAPRSRWTRS